MNGRLLRWAAVATGVLTLVAFGVAAYLVQTEGFPDGHLTAYEHASRLPRLVVCGLGGLCSAALVAGAARPQATPRTITTLALVVALLLTIQLHGIPYWYLDVQQLENGGGG